MRHSKLNIVAATVAITGVVGAGVAVAADAPACPYGTTPQAAQKAPARGSGDRTQLRLRERDGTGQRRAQHNGRRQGGGPGSHGAVCPYRS